MDELRENCPWDKKQTWESLRHLTIEETYELSDAILNGNIDEVKKELGDLILHNIFYARIASEKKQFDVSDVLNSICEKLIERHPHVYGDVVATDLFSYAMPIIRYKVGDIASYSAKECSCGRGLPLIASVEGRVSGFLIGSGGKKIHGGPQPRTGPVVVDCHCPAARLMFILNDRSDVSDHTWIFRIGLEPRVGQHTVGGI